MSGLKKPFYEILALLACIWLGLLLQTFLLGSDSSWTIEPKNNGMRRFLLGDSLEAEYLASKEASPDKAFDAEARLQELLRDEEANFDFGAEQNPEESELLAEEEPQPPLGEELPNWQQYIPKFLRGKQDTSSKFILLTGDSMTEELRFAFQNYARRNGHKLVTCIWYSSNTKIWSETKRLAQLIEEYRPSLVLFTLGGNELFIRDVEKREPYIKDIIRQADSRSVPFIWMGPPNWKEDTGLNDLIEKNVGRERYYPSKNLILARKSDGAHPTRAASAIWADSIGAWFQEASLYKDYCLFLPYQQVPKTAYRAYQASKLDTLLYARRMGKSVRILSADEKPLRSASPVLASAKQEEKKQASDSSGKEDKQLKIKPTELPPAIVPDSSIRRAKLNAPDSLRKTKKDSL